MLSVEPSILCSPETSAASEACAGNKAYKTDPPPHTYWEKPCATTNVKVIVKSHPLLNIKFMKRSTEWLAWTYLPLWEREEKKIPEDL